MLVSVWQVVSASIELSSKRPPHQPSERTQNQSHLTSDDGDNPDVAEDVDVDIAAQSDVLAEEAEPIGTTVLVPFISKDRSTQIDPQPVVAQKWTYALLRGYM